MRSKEVDNDDSVGFRRWLNSLTLEDLQEALQVALNNKDDDWNMLNAMVSQQYFPQAPVHPCALGYKQATESILPSLEYSFWNRRRNEPRMFKLWRDTSTSSSSSCIVPQVLARKCVSPWGQVWGVGCTQAQRDADDFILYHARIQGWADGQERCLVLDLGKHGKEKIVRMLQIASRGNIAAPIPLDASASISQIWKQPLIGWLEPTSRFFSLPLYLSRVFCGSLWHRYWTISSSGTKSIPLKQPSMPYSEDIVKRALEGALIKATRHLLDSSSSKEQVKHIRDGLLWKLLLETRKDVAMHPFWKNLNAASHQTPSSGSYFFEEWTSIPVHLLSSSQRDFVSLLLPFIQEQLALAMERQLLEDLSFS